MTSDDSHRSLSHPQPQTRMNAWKTTHTYTYTYAYTHTHSYTHTHAHTHTHTDVASVHNSRALATQKQKLGWNHLCKTKKRLVPVESVCVVVEKPAPPETTPTKKLKKKKKLKLERKRDLGCFHGSYHTVAPRPHAANSDIQVCQAKHDHLQ